MSENRTESKKGGKTGLVIAVIVLLIAVCLAFFFYNRHAAMNETIQELQTELEESQTRWQETAAKKEELQQELAQVEEDIREATLTLDESTAKIADLTEQITVLNNTNDGLKAQINAIPDTAAIAAEHKAAIEEAATWAKKGSIVLQDQMKRASSGTGGLWNAVNTARLALLDALKTEQRIMNDEVTQMETYLASIPDQESEDAGRIKAVIEEAQAHLDEITSWMQIYASEEELAD